MCSVIIVASRLIFWSTIWYSVRLAPEVLRSCVEIDIHTCTCQRCSHDNRLASHRAQQRDWRRSTEAQDESQPREQLWTKRKKRMRGKSGGARHRPPAGEPQEAGSEDAESEGPPAGEPQEAGSEDAESEGAEQPPQ